MKIKTLDIYHLTIPMRLQFAQANSTAQSSSSIIVKLKTENGITGFGESCPRTYVTGESSMDVIHALQSIREEVYTKNFETINSIANYVCTDLPRRLKPAAICALELALLDAWSKVYQTPLLQALGGSSWAQNRYTGVLPFGDLKKLAPILKRFAFDEIKLKANTSVAENISRIQQLRQIYDDTLNIRVDANCSWNFPTAMEQSIRLIEAGVTCIEQPFSPCSDKAMSTLTRHYGEWVDIMADESLTDYQSAASLIAQQACNRFNFKISKNGGLLNSLRMYRLAQSHGIKCQLGAHFGETSILTAAGLIFASLAPGLVATEGGLGTHLLEQDISLNPLMINRHAKIPMDAQQVYGLGIHVNEALLAIPEEKHQACTTFLLS
jgi:L-alanine-DL-glutamate epimerase-like enolase superfamily enzyme